MVPTLVILGVAAIAFASNKVSMGIVAIGVSVSLWATGVLTLDQALAGFGDPTVIFIASLFVVSEALDSTGVTAWAADQVMGRARSSRVRLVVIVSLLVALVTAFISINGAVAALIPVVVVVAARANLSPSQLLLPLAFAAHAGSLLALTGTPVNIIVRQFAIDAGERPFGFFEFALAGLPLLVGTIVVVALLGPRLLPVRNPASLPGDLAAHIAELRQHYELGDEELVNRIEGVAEVMIAPRSNLIGLHLFPGMTTPSGDLVVRSIRRGGDELKDRGARLRAGDVLLVSGPWDDLERHTADPDVLVVTPPGELRRGVLLGNGAKRALVVLAIMVTLLATGLLPPAIAGLGAAVALVVMRVVTPRGAYRSISWTTVVLIAGMVPLSTAFVQTGTADALAEGLLRALGDSGPRVALAAICIIAMILGQLVSNAATVLIIAPVALAVANELAVSPLPMLMGLAVAGAAAFLTPVATPANMMVMEPAGYRFGDYWRLGLPLLIMYLVVAVWWVPVFLPF